MWFLKALTPPLGWKCPKRFKLGLGKPWESESSSDSDLDDFITKRRFDAEEAVSDSNDIFVLASQRFEEEYCKDKSPVSDSDDIFVLASQRFKEEYCKDKSPVSDSDDIFVLALQRFEEEYCKDKSPVSDTDEILLLASQQFEENYGGKEMSEVDGVLRYGSLKTSKQIDDVRKLGVPVKTRDQNKWVCRIFSDWAQYRLQSVCVEEEEKQHLLVEDFC